MTQFDAGKVAEYINQARTNPKDFSNFIKQDIDSFRPDGRMMMKSGVQCITNGGKSVWQEAY